MYQAIEDWLNWLSVSKSAATVAGYRWEMMQVAAWLAKSRDGLGGSDVSPLAVKTGDLTRYLAERRLMKGVGDSTIKRSVAAMRSFFGWVCGRRSPAAAVPFPNVKSRKQRTPSVAELDQVLAAQGRSRRGLRDRALLLLMLDTGLRAAEVCRLRLADLDLDRRSLSVVVKGGDEKDAVFSSATSYALGEWLVARGACEAGTVFVNVAAFANGKPLTTSGLRVIFRRMGRAAGLAKFSPHDMRRAFAVHAHRLGAPSRLVQMAGRWEDLKLVERYTAGLVPHDFDPYFPTQLLGR